MRSDFRIGDREPYLPEISKDMIKRMPQMGKVAKYAPITGSLADMALGYNSIKQNHPWIGAGQMAFGLGGLGLDLAGLLTAPTTGGTSVAGAQGLKALARAGLRNLGNKAIKYGANRVSRPLTQQMGVAGLELAKHGVDDIIARHPEEMVGGTGNIVYDKKTGKPKFEYIDETSLTGSKSIPAPQGAIPNLPTLRQKEDIPQQQQVSPQDLGDLNEYFARLNEINKPYMEAMGRYLNDYNQLADDAFQQQRFFTSEAGYTGNEAYNDLGKSYSPLQNRANEMDIAGKMRDVQLGNVGTLANALGDSAVAMSMGLPSRAGLASKDMMNAYTNREKAQLGLQGRMYTADRGLEGRQYGADMGYMGHLADGTFYGNYQNPIAISLLQAQGMYNPIGLPQGGGYANDPYLDSLYFSKGR